MRLVAAAAGAVLVLVASLTPATAQIGSNEVRVGNNFFDPDQIRIEPGATVTWVVETSGHSITAEDGRFDFDRPPAGETREYTFGTEDEAVSYYCRYHGAPGRGMHGYVLVGDATLPTPEPTPEPTPPPTRLVPSAEYPSIAAALTGAAPDTVIEVAPGGGTGPDGAYREGRLRVRAPRITVRGTGTSPADVAVDSTGFTDGFIATEPGVRFENLTVRGARRAGISIDGADGYVLERVALNTNGAQGLSASGSRGGLVRNSTATGSGEAGFSITGCADCDTIVEGVTATDNAYGYAGINAGGVVVRNSTFTGNATGLLLASLPTEEALPQRGTHAYGNTIADNDGATTPREGLTETFDAPDGVGVWVAGGWYDTLEANTISGHDRYGVVVSWLTAPALADRVIDNTVSGSGIADLAWDGLGANVCFTGNRTPTGETPSSVPAGAQDLYGCDAPVTAGVPQPQITAELVRAGVEHHLP